jgi:hypothetical protein
MNELSCDFVTDCIHNIYVLSVLFIVFNIGDTKIKKMKVVFLRNQHMFKIH